MAEYHNYRNLGHGFGLGEPARVGALRSPRWYGVREEAPMFKSNAVRSCVELHAIEMNRFFEAWLAFRGGGHRVAPVE